MYIIMVNRWHGTNSVLVCVTAYSIRLIINGYPILLLYLTNILQMYRYTKLMDWLLITLYPPSSYSISKCNIYLWLEQLCIQLCIYILSFNIKVQHLLMLLLLTSGDLCHMQVFGQATVHMTNSVNRLMFWYGLFRLLYCLSATFVCVYINIVISYINSFIYACHLLICHNMQHHSIQFPTYLAIFHYHNRLLHSSFIVYNVGSHVPAYWMFLCSFAQGC